MWFCKGEIEAIRAAAPSAAASTASSEDAAEARPAVSTAVLIVEDIVGPPPSPDLVPDLKAALDQLEVMTGLRAVKEATLELMELSRMNYQRELVGREPLLVPLNRLFLGNPGTGKSSSMVRCECVTLA